MPTDIIDDLVGIAPGSPLDAIRARRQEARTNAQASYAALFAPSDMAGVTEPERFAIASFIAGLHGEPQTMAFYAAALADSAPELLSGAVDAAIAEARSEGPYGHYPAGPLTVEDKPGATWRVDPVTARILEPRLVAAFEHMHMLTFHPRDASAAALQALLDAGWTTTDIVTLSQIAAFLAFQIRTVAGLRVLAASL